jgi:hypothetical protein
MQTFSSISCVFHGIFVFASLESQQETAFHGRAAWQ